MSYLAVDYNKDTEIVDFVRDQWSNKDEVKGDLEANWLRNIAWYLGYQNYSWDSDHKRFFRTNADGRVNLIVNLLRAAVRQNLSKMGSNEPIWMPIPATQDAADIDKAELAKSVLSYEWTKTNMPRIDPRLDLWTLITGNSFSKVKWNPDAGPLFTFETEGEITTEQIPIGDTEVEIVSPFEMLFPNGYELFEDLPWCMQTYIKNLDELQEEYPEAEDIGSEHLIQSGFGVNHTNYLQKVFNLTQRFSNYMTSGSTLDEEDNLIYVHELWIKPRPSGKLEDGKFIIVAGNKVLHNIDFPYAHRKLPFQHRVEIECAGRVWGDSSLQDLIPIQKDYNKTKSLLLEARELMANPKWAVRQGSVPNRNAITNRPGEVIEYVSTPPEPISPPSMPNYVLNTLSQHRTDFEDISGQHEVSRAEAPGQVRSGSGISLLLQQDETRIRAVKRNKEDALSKMGEQLLSLNAQFVTEERIIRIVGDNDELTVRSFTGDDLADYDAFKPGIEYFDVRIKSTSNLPSTPEAQRELVSSLVAQGVYNPRENEKDNKLVRHLLNLGTVSNQMDDSTQHRTLQRQEIEQLTQGEQVTVKKYHDHIIHLEVLKQYMNSAKFMDLDPQIQGLLEQHFDQHLVMQAMNAVEPQVNQQIAMQMLTQEVQNGQGVPQGQV